MDEICQDDQWFEQAFTYMNQHDIPLANDKKLHVRSQYIRARFRSNVGITRLVSFMGFLNKQLLAIVISLNQVCLILSAVQSMTLGRATKVLIFGRQETCILKV